MRITSPQLARMKDRQKICMLTCYDATFARLLDASGVDVLLVGDSLGMVVKGESDTLNVSVDEITYHVRAVARGCEKSHIVADMPFLSYQASDEDAVRNAGRLLQAGAQSVKLEGGVPIAPCVKKLVACGIPVMGHIGMTPQSVHAFGGFVMQGKTEITRRRILEDALAIQDAGAFAIVLECMDAQLAKEITKGLKIPTIGIGAGPDCDGQVLVIYDVLGLDDRFSPKFVKHYLDGTREISTACANYVSDVRDGSFPAKQHTYYAPSNGINEHVL